ncbi:hypothetical protein CYIG_00064 [Cyanophage NATL1A-7]|uniref:Predicted protein n=1 Tax=Cyanophage NATL1A-7 TaxID=445693 RepID=E3SND3_9CAUD|nr:hypothetical protein CYIG_00064 [Cyanophage NATL1A-7]ADP00137.1 predicted protein [Cyanophage NATL1A-7]
MAHTKVTKTYSQNTGAANTFSYSGSFDVFKGTEVQVELDNIPLTFTASTINDSALSPREYSVDTSAKTIHIGGADLSSGTIVIRPVTDMGAPTPRATYAPGSSITSEDLNNNQLQLMRKAMEYDEQKLSSLGGTMTGHLTMGEDQTIIFEGATDDGYETTLTVADPTADHTITLPNITGTVVTTGDTATVSALMLAENSVDSSELVDGSIDTSHISSGAVTTAKLAADVVTGAKIADDAIDSEHYTDGSIDTAHIADAQVTTAKLADSSVTTAKIVDGTIVNADISTGAAIAHSKLSTMSAGNVLIGNSSNVPNSTTISGDVTITSSGVVTIGNEAVGTAKIAADAITGAKIANDAIDSEHYVNGSIDSAHIGDDQIISAKIADDAVDSEHLAAGSIDTEHIAGSQVTAAKLASNSVTTDKITDANVTTAKIADDAITIAKVGCEQTTISDSDSHIPTSGAVIDYVSAQIAPIGGLEVIADEDNFPTTQPAAGVVISIADAGGVVFNGSGVSTTARTAGNGSDNVTINNAPSSLYSETLAAGVGMQVSSTGSSHTYNYHKILAKEADVKQLSDDINDFNSRYRINAGEPGSNNDDGDLVWDTNANKMKVYDATASAWTEVTSTGDFKFLVPVDAGTTTAATWDGNDTSFDLKETTNSGSAASVSNINQLIVSLNGVIQKPNTGSYDASEEGFYLTDSDTIRFCTAPPSGSTAFILQIGSAVSIPTPGDGTVTTAKIASDAVTGAKIADDAVGAEHIELLDAPLHIADATNLLIGTGSDLKLWHYSDHSYIRNETGNLTIEANSAGDDAIKIIPDGAVELYHNNQKKIETISNGARIYSEDGAEAVLEYYADRGDQDADKFRTLASVNADWFLQNYYDGSWETNIKALGSGSVELYYDNVKTFETNDSGIKVFGPEGGSSFIYMHADEGDDNADKYHLQVDQDGTGFYIKNEVSGSTETNLRALGNGAVELYYDSSVKFNTSSDGATCHGSLSFVDSNKLKLGTGNDLEIYHNGSHSYLAQSGTGNIVLDVSSGQGTFIQTDSSSYSNLSVNNSHSDADSVDFFQCRDSSNNLKLQILSGGAVQNANNIYQQISDVKLKENIVDANSQWEDIKAIKIRNWNFKASTGLATHKQIGVVAQEIETISPGLIDENIDRDPETQVDLGTKTKSVKYSILYMKAIKALQEAMAKIETLETKVAALEAK